MRKRRRAPETVQPSKPARMPIASLKLDARTVNLLENQAKFIYCDQICHLAKKEIQSRVVGLGDKVLANLARALDAEGIQRPKDWLKR